MQEIGFKDQAAFSIEQLITLAVFALVVFLLAYLIRKNKDAFGQYLRLNKPSSRYSVEVQKLNSKTFLYRICDEKNEYLVFKSPEGVTQLNIQNKDDDTGG
jgi:hypothetical protein